MNALCQIKQSTCTSHPPSPLSRESMLFLTLGPLQRVHFIPAGCIAPHHYQSRPVLLPVTSSFTSRSYQSRGSSRPILLPVTPCVSSCLLPVTPGATSYLPPITSRRQRRSGTRRSIPSSSTGTNCRYHPGDNPGANRWFL